MGHGESKLGGAYEPKVKEMLANGQDPKDYLIEYCRPECKKWEDKLRRC
jgi:ubiquinol-cytochrome c reductase subunit 6